MLVELLAVPAAVLEHGAHRGLAEAAFADTCSAPSISPSRTVASGVGAVVSTGSASLAAAHASDRIAVLSLSRASPGLPGLSNKNYSFFSGYEIFLGRAILGSCSTSRNDLPRSRRNAGKRTPARGSRRESARASPRRDRAADRREGLRQDDDRSDRQAGRGLLGHLLRALRRQGRVLRRDLRSRGRGGPR